MKTAILGALLLAALSASCHLPSSGAGETVLLHKLQSRHDAGPALQLERWHYRLGTAQGELWLCRIDPARVELSVEVSNAEPRPLIELLPVTEDPRDGFVAINGAFYDDRGPLGLVISHGHQVQRFRRDGGSGVLVLNGELTEIVHRDSFVPSTEIQHALQSIDRLVAEGRNLVTPSSKPRRDARSMVGIDTRGQLTLLAIYDDDAVAQDAGGYVYLNRQTTTTGPTLHQLAEFASRPRRAGGLGLHWALNLDGGWSTSLAVQLGGRRYGVVGYRGTVNAVQVRLPRSPHR